MFIYQLIALVRQIEVFAKKQLPDSLKAKK